MRRETTVIGGDSSVAAATPAGTLRPGEPSRGHQPKVLIETTGGRGRLTRETFRELWLYREVLSAFTVRSVKVRYKQAAIGVAWAVIQPVLAAILFAVFLGRLSHLGSEGAPYLLFALAGMVCWTFFSGGASAAMASLVQDGALLRKVYFPREILPFAALLSSLVDYVPALLTLIVAAALYGDYPAVSWIALPAPLVIMIFAAGALGVAAAGANVYYRDIRYALPFVLQLGLFASPIAYSLGVVPASWRTAYAILNPVAAAIDGERRIVVHGTWPQLWPTVGALVWSFVLFVLAYAYFKRVERGFSDRI